MCTLILLQIKSLRFKITLFHIKGNAFSIIYRSEYITTVRKLWKYYFYTFYNKKIIKLVNFDFIFFVI